MTPCRVTSHNAHLLVLPPAIKKGTSQPILSLATCSNLIKGSRWKFQYIRCQIVPIIFHLFEKTLGLGGISNLYGSHRITCNMNCYDYNYGVFQVSSQARWIPIGYWCMVPNASILQCQLVSLVEKKKVFWVVFCDMSYMIKLFFCTSKVSIG